MNVSIKFDIDPLDPWAVCLEMRRDQKVWQTDGRTDGQAHSYSLHQLCWRGTNKYKKQTKSPDFIHF